MKKLLLAAVAASALAACSTEPAANDMNDANAMAGAEALPSEDNMSAPLPADENASDADGGNNAATPAPPPADMPAMIPAQYRGRWGMVPLDCTGDPSAAKGLITIDGSTIKFYESRGTLKEQRPAIATSFSGLYDFVGEGQKWQKVMTLTRTGDTLKRAEEEGTFTYTRCA